MRATTVMWLMVTASVAAVTQATLEGCYDSSVHKCDCDATENSCQTSGGIWDAGCSCVAEGDKKIDLPCPWRVPGPYGCESIPTNTTGVTGEIFEVVLSGNDDVWRVMDATKYDGCDMSGAEELTPATKKSQMFRFQINLPGTYLLTSSKSDSCANGLKYPLSITGASRGDNVISSENMYAPDHTSPGPNDDWTAFGKGVFHQKAYDDELHTPCVSSDAFCLDRRESRGSCYYSLEDFHIGHAIFCDVSEVECCGYQGCSNEATDDKPSYRGKFSNGTSHGYYFYGPGYTSGRGDECCHCYASCDVSSAASTCTYRDVTHSTCQRAEDRDSLEENTIGFLSCALPDGMTATDATIREEVATPSNAPDSGDVNSGDVNSGSVTVRASSWDMVVIALLVVIAMVL